MAGHDTLNVGTVVRPHLSEPIKPRSFNGRTRRSERRNDGSIPSLGGSTLIERLNPFVPADVIILR